MAFKSQLSTGVRGVTIQRMRRVIDPRGNLCAGEFAKDIPFRPKRFFVVFDVPNSKQRGQHAHKRCHQFLLCIAGRLKIKVDDGVRTKTLTLKPLTQGVYVPPGVWCSQFSYSRGAALLVFASDYYDADDYIRDYQVFKRLRTSISPVK